MDRRDLLGTVGAAASGALAGCLDDPLAASGGSPPEDGTPSASGDNQRPCPPIPFEDGRTRCSDGADDWGVAVTVDPPEIELPRGECRITLENRGSRLLESTADAVSLYARRDGRWAHLFQKTDETVLEFVNVPPGGRRTFTVAANTADLAPVYPPGERDGEQRFVFRFTPGTYALGYRVSRGDGDRFSTDDGSEDRVYARTFSVDGAAPALEPSAVHEETFRRDGSVVVRTGTEREYDHSRRVTLNVERVTTRRADAARLSRFELYNPGYELVADPGPDRVFITGLVTGLLRDAFATAGESTDRIRVETVDTTKPPLGLQAPKAVRYDGTTWRLSATEGWGGDG